MGYAQLYKSKRKESKKALYRHNIQSIGNTISLQEELQKYQEKDIEENPYLLIPYKAKIILEKDPSHWTEEEFLYLWRDILAPEERIRIANYLDRFLPWERGQWFKQKTKDTIEDRGKPVIPWPGERRPTEEEQKAIDSAVLEHISRYLGGYL